MKYYRQKHPTQSKIEPHQELITTLLDSGLKIREVADAIEPLMDDVVDENALYCYAKTKGLLSNGLSIIPRCEGCESCIMIINTNESEVRLCLTAKRVVSRSVRTSPVWCDKRKGEKVG